jgi:hypothetical chaperone protein
MFEAIDATKRALSDDDAAPFRFDYPSIDLSFPIQRAGFEAAIAPALERILSRLDETLAAAGVSPADVDRVYCTGGTARVPAFLSAVSARFGAEKVRHMSTFHAVIQGLGERARSLVAEGKLGVGPAPSS